MGRSRTRQLWQGARFALLTMLLAVACATSQSGGTGTVRGVLLQVQASSISQADEIEVRAEDGRVLRFAVSEEVSMTPGHLREHMMFGQPVTVTYRVAPSGLVAIDIQD